MDNRQVLDKERDMASNKMFSMLEFHQNAVKTHNQKELIKIINKSTKVSDDVDANESMSLNMAAYAHGGTSSKLVQNKAMEYREKFVIKLISYIQRCTKNNADIEDVRLVIWILAHVIKIMMRKAKFKGQNFSRKTKIQMKFDSLGATDMLLSLMTSDRTDFIDELFPLLVLFSNKLLDGGLEQLQEKFYEHFTMHSLSENLFERCYTFIGEDIYLLQKHKSPDHSKGVKVFRFEVNVHKQIIGFMKLLCENHNTALQLYIANQTNSKKNYDMVTLIVHYLHALIKNLDDHKTYNNANMCLIGLSEFVQGPCKTNQDLVKDANFFLVATSILSEVSPNQ